MNFNPIMRFIQMEIPILKDLIGAPSPNPHFIQELPG